MIQAELDEQSMTRQGARGHLRAFDKKNGDLLWEYEMEPTPHGTPMTYMHEGKQYVVLAAGGDGQPSQLIAFALGEE